MLTQIPVTNDPNQSFTVTVGTAALNRTFDLFMNWNRIAGYWQISITDTATKTELIDSLPMVTGLDYRADLFDQFKYLGMGGLFVIPLSTSSSDTPGIDDWGTNFALVWWT